MTLVYYFLAIFGAIYITDNIPDDIVLRVFIQVQLILFITIIICNTLLMLYKQARIRKEQSVQELNVNPIKLYRLEGLLLRNFFVTLIHVVLMVALLGFLIFLSMIAEDEDHALYPFIVVLFNGGVLIILWVAVWFISIGFRIVYGKHNLYHGRRDVITHAEEDILTTDQIEPISKNWWDWFVSMIKMILGYAFAITLFAIITPFIMPFISDRFLQFSTVLLIIVTIMTIFLAFRHNNRENKLYGGMGGENIEPSPMKSLENKMKIWIIPLIVLSAVLAWATVAILLQVLYLFIPRETLYTQTLLNLILSLSIIYISIQIWLFWVNQGEKRLKLYFSRNMPSDRLELALLEGNFDHIRQQLDELSTMDYSADVALRISAIYSVIGEIDLAKQHAKREIQKLWEHLRHNLTNRTNHHIYLDMHLGLLAEIHLLENDLDEAQNIIQRALKISPNSPPIYYALANWYYVKNQPDKIKETLQHLDRLQGKDILYPISYYMLWAIKHAYDGDRKKVADSLKQVKQQTHNAKVFEVEALLAQGRTERILKDYEQARKNFEKVIRTYPKSSMAKSAEWELSLLPN